MEINLVEIAKSISIIFLIIFIFAIVKIQLYVSRIDGKEKDTAFFTLTSSIRYMEITRKATGKTGKLLYIMLYSFLGFMICLVLSMLLV